MVHSSLSQKKYDGPSSSTALSTGARPRLHATAAFCIFVTLLLFPASRSTCSAASVSSLIKKPRRSVTFALDSDGYLAPPEVFGADHDNSSFSSSSEDSEDSGSGVQGGSCKQDDSDDSDEDAGAAGEQSASSDEQHIDIPDAEEASSSSSDVEDRAEVAGRGVAISPKRKTCISAHHNAHSTTCTSSKKVDTAKLKLYEEDDLRIHGSPSSSSTSSPNIEEQDANSSAVVDVEPESEQETLVRRFTNWCLFGGAKNKSTTCISRSEEAEPTSLSDSVSDLADEVRYAQQEPPVSGKTAAGASPPRSLEDNRVPSGKKTRKQRQKSNKLKEGSPTKADQNGSLASSPEQDHATDMHLLTGSLANLDLDSAEIETAAHSPSSSSKTKAKGGTKKRTGGNPFGTAEDTHDQGQRQTDAKDKHKGQQAPHSSSKKKHQTKEASTRSPAGTKGNQELPARPGQGLLHKMSRRTNQNANVEEDAVVTKAQRERLEQLCREEAEAATDKFVQAIKLPPPTILQLAGAVAAQICKNTVRDLTDLAFLVVGFVNAVFFRCLLSQLMGAIQASVGMIYEIVSDEYDAADLDDDIDKQAGLESASAAARNSRSAKISRFLHKLAKALQISLSRLLVAHQLASGIASDLVQQLRVEREREIARRGPRYAAKCGQLDQQCRNAGREKGTASSTSVADDGIASSGDKSPGSSGVGNSDEVLQEQEETKQTPPSSYPAASSTAQHSNTQAAEGGDRTNINLSAANCKKAAKKALGKVRSKHDKLIQKAGMPREMGDQVWCELQKRVSTEEYLQAFMRQSSTDWVEGAGGGGAAGLTTTSKKQAHRNKGKGTSSSSQKQKPAVTIGDTSTTRSQADGEMDKITSGTTSSSTKNKYNAHREVALGERDAAGQELFIRTGDRDSRPVPRQQDDHKSVQFSNGRFYPLERDHEAHHSHREAEVVPTCETAKDFVFNAFEEGFYRGCDAGWRGLRMTARILAGYTIQRAFMAKVLRSNHYHYAADAMSSPITTVLWKATGWAIGGELPVNIEGEVDFQSLFSKLEEDDALGSEQKAPLRAHDNSLLSIKSQHATIRKQAARELKTGLKKLLNDMEMDKASTSEKSESESPESDEEEGEEDEPAFVHHGEWMKILLRRAKFCADLDAAVEQARLEDQNDEGVKQEVETNSSCNSDDSSSSLKTTTRRPRNTPDLNYRAFVHDACIPSPGLLLRDVVVVISQRILVDDGTYKSSIHDEHRLALNGRGMLRPRIRVMLSPRNDGKQGFLAPKKYLLLKHQDHDLLVSSEHSGEKDDGGIEGDQGNDWRKTSHEQEDDNDGAVGEDSDSGTELKKSEEQDAETARLDDVTMDEVKTENGTILVVGDTPPGAGDVPEVQPDASHNMEPLQQSLTVGVEIEREKPLLLATSCEAEDKLPSSAETQEFLVVEAPEDQEDGQNALAEALSSLSLGSGQNDSENASKNDADGSVSPSTSTITTTSTRTIQDDWADFVGDRWVAECTNFCLRPFLGETLAHLEGKKHQKEAKKNGNHSSKSSKDDETVDPDTVWHDLVASLTSTASAVPRRPSSSSSADAATSATSTSAIANLLQMYEKMRAGLDPNALETLPADIFAEVLDYSCGLCGFTDIDPVSTCVAPKDLAKKMHQGSSPGSADSRTDSILPKLIDAFIAHRHPIQLAFRISAEVNDERRTHQVIENVDSENYSYIKQEVEDVAQFTRVRKSKGKASTTSTESSGIKRSLLLSARKKNEQKKKRKGRRKGILSEKRHREWTALTQHYVGEQAEKSLLLTNVFAERHMDHPVLRLDTMEAEEKFLEELLADVVQIRRSQRRLWPEKAARFLRHALLLDLDAIVETVPFAGEIAKAATRLADWANGEDTSDFVVQYAKQLEAERRRKNMEESQTGKTASSSSSKNLSASGSSAEKNSLAYANYLKRQDEKTRLAKIRLAESLQQRRKNRRKKLSDTMLNQCEPSILPSMDQIEETLLQRRRDRAALQKDDDSSSELEEVSATQARKLWNSFVHFMQGVALGQAYCVNVLLKGIQMRHVRRRLAENIGWGPPWEYDLFLGGGRPPEGPLCVSKSQISASSNQTTSNGGGDQDLTPDWSKRETWIEQVQMEEALLDKSNIDVAAEEYRDDAIDHIDNATLQLLQLMYPAEIEDEILRRDAEFGWVQRQGCAVFFAAYFFANFARGWLTDIIREKREREENLLRVQIDRIGVKRSKNGPRIDLEELKLRGLMKPLVACLEMKTPQDVTRCIKKVLLQDVYLVGGGEGSSSRGPSSSSSRGSSKLSSDGGGGGGEDEAAGSSNSPTGGGSEEGNVRSEGLTLQASPSGKKTKNNNKSKRDRKY
ncbi:unnamed protein product [Amoebophrya sp. A25]|nr:unnamed protein product [Amoebophrya sp. A25]|eukprot:GSA25T00012298001.1